jgi:hypothetical protein
MPVAVRMRNLAPKVAESSPVYRLRETGVGIHWFDCIEAFISQPPLVWRIL